VALVQPARAARKVTESVSDALAEVGRQLLFYGRVLWEIVRHGYSMLRYRSLIFSLVSDVTIGAGFTAQLGAMRISEEVDALEVMAVPSVPFLITTRMIAGVIAIIPMYTIGLLASFAASRLNVTLINGLAGGTYDHYFDLFLPVSDVLYSYLKVIVFAIVIILIHCHYGYTARGGPAGVGIAVGRSVRLSIVSTAILDFFLTLVLFGTETSVRVAG
jgi:phospholipid/cholesterol/gamma-HCH transport system permease protein